MTTTSSMALGTSGARSENGGELLRVNDLFVSFVTNRGRLDAVNGVSLSVGRGETLAVVGESGSGKSVTARAIMGLVPQPPGRIHSSGIFFDGEDLTALSDAELRRRRWTDIAMIFQDPMRSLNPTMRIGAQIIEAIRTHENVTESEARERTVELLDTVRLPLARERTDQYPHQLSGGMRQRVMIAMALACRPRLLIADEPTTALDVTIQAQILDLLADLQEETGMAMILVTHDLGVAAWHSDRIAVMYAGQVVESAPTDQIYDSTAMPYTRALMDAIPRRNAHQERLASIPGRPPDMVTPPTGCPFNPRCPRVAELADGDAERCRQQMPGLSRAGADHEWRCHFPLELGNDR